MRAVMDLTLAESPVRVLAAMEPSLVVLASPSAKHAGKRFTVPATGLVVGRDSDADLQLDDAGVSRRHVRVERMASGDFRLVDLDSRNGTYVNGFRVRAATLCPGDRIQLGVSTTLRLIVGSEASQEDLLSALTAGRMAAWCWNVGSGALSWSDNAAGILEVEPNSVPVTMAELLECVHSSKLATVLAHAAETGAAFEIEFEMKLADRTHWVAMRGEALSDGNGDFAQVRGTIANESGRKQVEREVRRQAQVFDRLEDGVVVFDLDGRVLDCNLAVERTFGWSKQDLLARRFDRALWRRQDADLYFALERDGHWAGDVLCHARNGRDFLAEVVIVPMRDDTGGTVAWFGIHRDVDSRRQLESKLRVTERLASIGTLAAGLAHEINNPLAFVQSNVNMLVSDLEVTPSVDPDLVAMARDARDGVDRIASIVRDLRAFCRDECSTIPQPVDLRRAVEFAIRMSDAQVRSKATIELSLEKVPLVLGSEVRFGQVFLNLIVNAAQAIPEGADRASQRIRVSTRTEKGRAVVEVADTGGGIAPKDLDRIFDPFFTTKPVGEGTGLGLAICHSIVAEAGGEITVESRVGHGTTFTVALPTTG